MSWNLKILSTTRSSLCNNQLTSKMQAQSRILLPARALREADLALWTPPLRNLKTPARRWSRTNAIAKPPYRRKQLKKTRRNRRLLRRRPPKTPRRRRNRTRRRL